MVLGPESCLFTRKLSFFIRKRCLLIRTRARRVWKKVPESCLFNKKDTNNMSLLPKYQSRRFAKLLPVLPNMQPGKRPKSKDRPSPFRGCPAACYIGSLLAWSRVSLGFPCKRVTRVVNSGRREPSFCRCTAACSVGCM